MVLAWFALIGFLSPFLCGGLMYLNKEEDVKVWNHNHHSHYNIDCKKKKMNEYIVGKPELDIFSFDHINTHF